MRQAYPDWGPQEIKEKLKASTIIYTGDQAPDENGRDPDNTYGWGRVNALRALDAGPTVTSIDLGGLDTSSWFTSPVTLKASFTSRDSTDLLGFTTGPRELYWHVDGQPAGENVTLNGLGPSDALRGWWNGTFTTDGIHTLDVWGIDNGGNREANQTIEIKLDQTPPTTEPVLTGPAGENGWYTGSVTVELVCQDATSGCDATVYRLDGGAEEAYHEPFEVTGDGEHELAHRSTDVAGNEETTVDTVVRIDGTPPTTTADATAEGNGTSLELSATDATSGVDEIRIQVNDGSWEAYTGPIHLVPGDTVAYHSVDNAGLTDAIETVTLPVPSFTRPRQGHLTVGVGNTSLEQPLPPLVNITGAVTAGTVHFELAVDPLETTLTQVTLTVTNATGEVLHQEPMTLEGTTEAGRLLYTATWEPPAGPRFGLTAQATVENDQGAFAASSVALSTLGHTVETTAQRAPG